MSEKDPMAANYDMVLGEMRGQLREVVHTLNNLSTKFDQLTREVIALGPLAADIIDIKTRLKVIEETDNRQHGAMDMVMAIMRSPALGWLVGAVTSIYLILTGRVHI